MPRDQLQTAIKDVAGVLEESCEASDLALVEKEELADLDPRDLERASPKTRKGLAMVRRVRDLQHRLRTSAKRLREVEVRSLRDEGHTTEEIAKLLGVTRQRVSALLHKQP